jgi:hypothetical protein
VDNKLSNPKMIESKERTSYGKKELAKNNE